MKSRLAIVALFLYCANAVAQPETLICIWDSTQGKKQSYIVAFDAQDNSVNFNGAVATDPAISATEIKFTLRLKDVVWTHTINRADGTMQVNKSDGPDTPHLQCGKWSGGGF